MNQPNYTLPISKLSAVYNDTTNSYKFYWCLALLDELESTNQNELTFRHLTRKMVSFVWYPLDYHQLSFGKLDSFIKISVYISKICKIDNSAGAPDVFDQLKHLGDKEADNLQHL